MYCCAINGACIISTQMKEGTLSGIRLSFRARIFILVSVLMISSMTAMSIFLLKDLKDNMSEEFRERGLLLAREFSQKVAEGILIEDKEILDKFISQLCGSKDVLYVYIYGESGLKLAQKVLFEGIEDELPPKAKLDDIEIAKLFVGEKKHNAMLDITTPVSYEDERVGYIRLGISLERIREKVNKRILNSSILVVIFISIGLVMCFFFSRSFSKPISQLLEGVKKIGQGDLFHHVKVQNKDEIGELAVAFNQMMDDLGSKTTSIDNLKRAEENLKRAKHEAETANIGLRKEITERKQAEEQRNRLVSDLKKTLSEVKTLRGFLPICSNCKKIRDDKGYWNQIESYIRDRSDAEFSHGICPECAKKLYPDMDLYGENET